MKTIMTRAVVAMAGFVVASVALGVPARAQSEKGPPAADAGGPAPVPAFTKGLTPVRGLFTLWRKNGKVYVEIAPDQLDADFIETAVPASGPRRVRHHAGVCRISRSRARASCVSRMSTTRSS